MHRVTVQPELIRWARARSRKDAVAVNARFPKLTEWEDGSTQPTWRQLQDFAAYTYTPVGYFFLGEPPEEQVPIPDMRTIADRGVTSPSPDLLDTIYQCQQRQAWYSEYATNRGQPPSALVAQSDMRQLPNPAVTARQIAALTSIAPGDRKQARTWEEALRTMRSKIEAAGVMVMISGIVGSNTHRALDPEEFRGFALVDPLAPLIFVNGKSSKSAQMFTLAHELGHVWLGQSALSDANTDHFPTLEVERWCNQVAAELLVPSSEFVTELVPDEPIPRAMSRLARVFKVSTLVILRRLYEVGQLSESEFWQQHTAEVQRLDGLQRTNDGGDYYKTQPARVGRRFAEAIIVDTLEGRTLFRDAFRLLGVSKPATFNELARRLGIDA